MRRVGGAALAAAVLAPFAAGAGVDTSSFRYVREVTATHPEAVVVYPDGPMFAHAADGFPDLRVVDARGRQVPWRPLPERSSASGSLRATVLNSGRRGRFALALLDLGPRRRVLDRVELDVAGGDFVGRVVVSGADRRGGPFTRLSATEIYDVGGAQHARSTTVIVPPTDFRYLQLRATGVSRIDGATVSAAPQRAPLVRRGFTLRRSERGRETLLALDFGYRDVPVDELDVEARTRRYDRPLVVEASNDGTRFFVLARARAFRFPGSHSPPVVVGAARRFLRVRIDNGDDEPLRGIEIRARGQADALVLEDGHQLPYRLLYGSGRVAAPRYDFATIPFDSPTVPGTLGRERLNAAFERAPDTRGFFRRHGWAVDAALALAAVVVALGGVLALRRTA